MTGRRTAYTAEWVLPMASAPIRDGVVVVQGERIEFVGGAAPSARWSDADVVPLGRTALMPGLVNAHSHLELTVLRGFLEGLAFRTWLRTLTAVRSELLDDSAILDSARLGVREALANGITTCADTAASSAPLQAMREGGIRGIGYIETFGPHPAQAADSLALLRAAVAAQRPFDTARVRTGVSPHAPYSVSAPLFRAVAAYAREESLPIAVHIAESADEWRFVVEGDGAFAEGLRARDIPVSPQARSPIALLDACGVLDARPLLIHAIRSDGQDIARIAATGATVVHCPISNAKLGHGIAPVDALREAGVAVGLGTDSVASNDRMDLLSEARQATLLQALRRGVPDAMAASDALWLATMGGARALGLDARVGSLEVGKDADLAAFPLDAPDAGPIHDPTVTLVHVLAGAVRPRLVTVAGEVLVRDGTVLRQDPSLDERMSLLGKRLQEWRSR